MPVGERNGKAITVGEAIDELQKYPRDAVLVRRSKGFDPKWLRIRTIGKLGIRKHIDGRFDDENVSGTYPGTTTETVVIG